MSNEELLTLLARSRAVLDRYLFEANGESIRDDVAEICMAIDDVLPGGPGARDVHVDHDMLECSAA